MQQGWQWLNSIKKSPAARRGEEGPYLRRYGLDG